MPHLRDLEVSKHGQDDNVLSWGIHMWFLNLMLLPGVVYLHIACMLISRSWVIWDVHEQDLTSVQVCWLGLGIKLGFMPPRGDKKWYVTECAYWMTWALMTMRLIDRTSILANNNRAKINHSLMYALSWK